MIGIPLPFAVPARCRHVERKRYVVYLKQRVTAPAETTLRHLLSSKDPVVRRAHTTHSLGRSGIERSPGFEEHVGLISTSAIHDALSLSRQLLHT